MRTRFRRATGGFVVLLAAALGQSPRPQPPLRGSVSNQDFCSSGASCFTPARGPQCPQVRFGWGNCPGSRQACDWCYGPDGVFAYSPRGSVYTLSSGCNRLGSGATWSTKNSQVAQWMSNAGGNCASDGRGGYNCSNVDAARFKTAANCSQANQGSPQPSNPSNQAGGSCSTGASCYTPARGPQCPQVRFGWGDCPGSRKACDWCYGPNGVFAYSPRGSTYTLSSGCNQLGNNTTWSTKDPQVAQWMSSAGGNCASDGRGGYNCSNVDTSRYQQAANCNQPQAIFTYFYVNGVNTPRTNTGWRGSCQSEHDTVAQNLIDSAVSNPRIPRPSGTLQPIKAGNEQDRMYGLTCNPSGQDPWGDANWIAQNCPKQPFFLLAPVCALIKGINGMRAGSGLTPGDAFECVRQSLNLNLPPNLQGPPGVDIQATSKDVVVTQIVNAIVSAYQQEGNQNGVSTKNYFIVVSHSQGNFFAEGVAYNLLHYSGAVGRRIFSQRLGIISLGSPTSFETLRSGDPTGGFISSKIVHHTRADDAINIVKTIGDLAGKTNVSGKKPWPPNDPSLWPWPGWQPAQSLFSPDQLQFPCDPGKGFSPGNCDPFSALFFRRMQYDAGPSVSNPELYAPVMNSHLLDNYLDAPTATRPGIYLPPSKLMPWVISPRTTPVLNCIRSSLLQLKKNLLNGSADAATTSCPDG